MIGTVLSIGVVLFGVLMGYGTARRFVRDRLRFVDTAHKPSVPLIAGIVTFLVAVPIVNLISVLPLIHLGGGAAIALGASVGFGVRAGTRDVQLGRYELHS